MDKLKSEQRCRGAASRCCRTGRRRCWKDRPGALGCAVPARGHGRGLGCHLEERGGRGDSGGWAGWDHHPLHPRTRQTLSLVRAGGAGSRPVLIPGGAVLPPSVRPSVPSSLRLLRMVAAGRPRGRRLGTQSLPCGSSVSSRVCDVAFSPDVGEGTGGKDFLTHDVKSTWHCDRGWGSWLLGAVSPGPRSVRTAHLSRARVARGCLVGRPRTWATSVATSVLVGPAAQSGDRSQGSPGAPPSPAPGPATTPAAVPGACACCPGPLRVSSRSQGARIGDSFHFMAE